MEDFYTIQNQASDGTAYAFNLSLNGSHPIFNGHFPGNPIVPGVCSIMMIRQCYESIVGKPMRILNMNQCKFLQAITPKQSPLEITIEPKGDDVVVASVVFNGESMLSLKAKFTPR